MSDTNGIRHLTNLKIGFDELQWWQAEIHTRARVERLAKMLEPGWVGRRWSAGEDDFGWRVTDPLAAGAGTLYLVGGTQGEATYSGLQNRADVPWIGVDGNGDILELYHEDADESGTLLRDDTEASIVVPDDGVWYTLVAKYVLTPYAKGKLNLTGGSATVTGTDTDFTRYYDGADVRATLIRIDAGDTSNGNEGIYEFVTIADDNNCTITPTPPNSELDVRYRVIGEFFTGTPADPDIHNNAVVRWELRARTVDAPADGALIVADVMLDTGTSNEVQIIDRRRFNLYREVADTHQFYTLDHKWRVTQNGQALGGTMDWEPTHGTITGAFPATMTDLDIAPATVGNDLIGYDADVGAIMAFYESTTPALRILEFQPVDMYTPWRNPDGGAAVTATPAAGEAGDGISIIAVPPETGRTHLMFIGGTNGITMRPVTGDGAAIGSATLIWGPSGSDTPRDPDAVLTRSGRIIVVVEWFVNTGGYEELRYIFSDDYGVTWDTNSGVGYTILSVDEQLRTPRIDEDDLGNLWLTWTRAADTDAATVDHLYMGIGTGRNNPVLSPEYPEGWELARSVASVEENRSCIVAAPHGQAFVFANEHQGTPPSYVGFDAITWMSGTKGYQLHSEKLAETQASSSSGEQKPIGCCLLPTGRVLLAFVDHDDSFAWWFVLQMAEAPRTLARF